MNQVVDQAKFIWVARNSNPERILMNTDGITTVWLSDDIQIIHDSNNGKNDMSIVFPNKDKVMMIHNFDQLESIYKIHLFDEKSVEKIYRWCTKNLNE